MRKDASTGLYLPAKYHTEIEERGFGEKVATVDPYRHSYASIIDFDPGNEEPILDDTSIKRLLKEKKPSVLIPKLIRVFPLFSEALNLYKQNVNQGWDINCEDSRTLEICYEILDSLKQNNRDIDTIIEEQIYSLLAEGGVSFENVYDDDRNLIDLSPVSPNSLTFRYPKDDPYKRYMIIQKGLTSADDVTLYDPRDPEYSDENRFFFYRGVNTQQGKPRGISMFVSALMYALNSLEVDNMFIEHLRGQAFPRGFLSPKVADLIQSGITGQKLVNTIKDSVENLQKQLNTAGLSESVISSLGFEFVLLGALQRSNLDGGTIVSDNISYNVQVALDIPDTMLPSRKTQVLGEQSGRTQWTRWQNALQYLRKILGDQFEMAFQGAIYQRTGAFREHLIDFIFDNSDRESRLYEAQAFREEMEAWEIGIRNGIFSREEARMTTIAENSRFKELDPEALPELPTMEMEQQNGQSDS